ncbi:MAG: sialidase family protein [Candidatus Dormibacteraceae bacterium]
MRRLRLAFVAAAIATLVGTTTALGAAGVTTLSGPSPYAKCDNGTQTGTNFVNAEVEPYVAAHGNNLVAVWQQDRWSNGGAHGGAASASTDGGRTWHESNLPFSRCAPGGVNYERASDFWVSIGPDGTVYASGLPFDNTTYRNAVTNAVSSDGGLTWHDVVSVVSFDNASGYQFSTDKNSIAANPYRAGLAYTVWDTLFGPQDSPDNNAHTAAYMGPGYLSMTSDHGQSWSAPQLIFPTGQREQTIGNQILVAPDGVTLYDFANYIQAPNNFGKERDTIAFVKSTDGGATWSAPQTVLEMAAGIVTDPNTGATIRTGDIIPEPAIDPVTGKIYVTWQTTLFSGSYSEVGLISSADGGNTWTAPTRVNTPTGRPAFTPTVRVNGGKVAVTYYDFRNLAAGNTTTLPTDYWAKVSTDGGATFGNDIHLSGSWDMLTAPYARGYFVGDYEGLAAFDKGFVAVFGAANSGNINNRTDIFATTF